MQGFVGDERFVRRDAFGARRCRRALPNEWNVYGTEGGDRLRLTVFKNLEIRLRETAHEFPARVEHAHGNLHVIDLGSEGGPGINLGVDDRHDRGERRAQRQPPIPNP